MVNIIFMFRAVFALLIVLSVVGCKQENPNPELLDPIYKELLSESKETEKLLKESVIKLETLIKERGKLDLKSVERRVNDRETHKIQSEILMLKQKMKYIEIRTERRRVEARRDYKVAFRSSKVWPQPEEYKNYLISKRLKSAPMNWNYRVPKLHARNPNYINKEKVKK